MRILHVVPTYLPATRYGGPIRSVHGLCKALAARGHDVHVFTTNVDGPGVSPVPTCVPSALDGVQVTYFPTGLGRRLYRSPAMDAALEREVATFDVVHLHAVFLWPTTAAARAARRHGVPYVLAPRGMLVGDLIRRKSAVVKSAWIRLFERENLAGADSVHVTSDIEAEEIRRLGLRVRRFDVITNGFDPPEPGDAVVGADIGAPIVLCLGRINWKKGLDRLIGAIVHVPEARLVIAGNDEENYTGELKALSVQFGVAERVFFVGAVHGAEKWAWFRKADVFALASHSENFGIAVLEAMACGRPVLVTPEVGLAEVVAREGAGLVADGTPAAFGQALKRLAADPAARTRMGQAGRDLAQSTYSWAGIASRTEEVYEAIRLAQQRQLAPALIA
jgi:glycosyltransferase involved in cell wall biosynthesis